MTDDNVFQRLINDVIVVWQTVELLGFQIEKHVVTFLYTVSVRVRLEPTTCITIYVVQMLNEY